MIETIRKYWDAVMIMPSRKRAQTLFLIGVGTYALINLILFTLSSIGWVGAGWLIFALPLPVGVLLNTTSAWIVLPLTAALWGLLLAAMGASSRGLRIAGVLLTMAYLCVVSTGASLLGGL